MGRAFLPCNALKMEQIVSKGKKLNSQTLLLYLKSQADLPKEGHCQLPLPGPSFSGEHSCPASCPASSPLPDRWPPSPPAALSGRPRAVGLGVRAGRGGCDLCRKRPLEMAIEPAAGFSCHCTGPSQVLPRVCPWSPVSPPSHPPRGQRFRHSWPCNKQPPNLGVENLDLVTALQYGQDSAGTAPF